VELLISSSHLLIKLSSYLKAETQVKYRTISISHLLIKLSSYLKAETQVKYRTVHLRISGDTVLKVYRSMVNAHTLLQEITIPNKLTHVVLLLTCTWEVSSSNLGHKLNVLHGFP
jgi:hypothetical protein